LPVNAVIFFGCGAHRPVAFHAGNVRVVDKQRGRIEKLGFPFHGGDVGHGYFSERLENFQPMIQGAGITSGDV
jgi:hypothetical protein